MAPLLTAQLPTPSPILTLVRPRLKIYIYLLRARGPTGFRIFFLTILDTILMIT
jgi:hypothetical protein